MERQVMTARVLIVDDDAAVRTLIRLYVEHEPDLEVVGEARGCDEAVEALRALNPDIITMDFDMPNVNGVGCIKALKSEAPLTPILAVTASGEKVISEMLEAGAYGGLSKSHVAAVAPALREGLTRLASTEMGRSPRQPESSSTALEQLREAIERLDRQAAEALAQQKAIIGERFELLAALNAIARALDNPRYTVTQAIERIRSLTDGALESDAASV